MLILYAPYLVESYEKEIIKAIHLISHGVLSLCHTIFIFFFQAIDTMYFTSVGKDGSYCVLRIARRHKRKAEVWLSVKVLFLIKPAI